jgi:hypothetical protein
LSLSPSAKVCLFLKWPQVHTLWGIRGEPMQVSVDRRLHRDFSAELWPTPWSSQCYWNFTFNSSSLLIVLGQFYVLYFTLFRHLLGNFGFNLNYFCASLLL